MNEAEVRKLYNALIKKGYTVDQIGDENTFMNNMNDEGKRMDLYKYVSSKGNFGIGDYETYERRLTSSPNTPIDIERPTQQTTDTISLAVSANPVEDVKQDYTPKYTPRTKDVKKIDMLPEQESEYATGFGQGFKQGVKGLGHGIQHLGGEILNLFTGSTIDEEKALKRIAELERDGIDIESAIAPLDKAQKMYYETATNQSGEIKLQGLTDEDVAYAQKALENDAINKTIRKYIEKAGGLEEAKIMLAERANEETQGDKLIKQATEGLAELKPTKGFGAWVGNLTPQMIPAAVSMGVGVVTKNPTLTKSVGAVGMGAMTASTAGMSMNEAREAGATGLQTWAVGIADGAIEFVTEKIPFNRYTSRVLSGVKKKVGSDLSEAITNSPQARNELERLLQEANKRLGGKLFNGKNVKDFAGDIVAEGLSEFTAEALQTITPMIYENPEDYPTIGEILRNGWEGAKAGVFMGSVLGGASKTMEHYQHRNRRKEQGFVDIVEFETKDGSTIGELVGIKDDKFVVLFDGEAHEIVPENIIYEHKFRFEEFDRAELQMENEESFDNGYSLGEQQEMNDAKNTLIIAEKEMVRMFSLNDESEIEDFLGNDPIMTVATRRRNGEDEESSQAMLDYINAKATYDGMIQRVRDDIDGQIEQNNALIDSRTNKHTGKIHGAVSKEDGRRVYIVSGNVVKYDDGTGIDLQKSDGSIIIRDAESGELKMVSPEFLSSVYDVQDPNEQKEIDAQQIREKVVTEESNKIDGTVDFNNKEQFLNDMANQIAITMILAERGFDKEYIKTFISRAQIVENPDGTLTFTDGQNEVAVPKQEIQQQIDANARQRAVDFSEKRKEIRSAIQQATATPEIINYGIGDDVSLRDADGNIINGTISMIEDDTYIIDYNDGNGTWHTLDLTQQELDDMIVEHNGVMLKQPVTEQKPVEETYNNINNTSSTKGNDNGVQEWYTNIHLSGELDQNNVPFVLSPDGNVDFGYIESMHNLPEAPIRLSMGDISNGYIHINKRHGNEIKKAGFNSIEEFIKYVADNFTRIQEGSAYDNSNNDKNQSYLIQLQDGHNNTLFVQLSRDSKYWNVNSAGIFGKSYGNKKKNIWSASEVQNDNSAVVSDGSQSEPIAENGSTSNGTPSKSSEYKDNNSFDNNNNTQEKVSAISLIPKDESGNPIYEQADSETAWDALLELTKGNETRANTLVQSTIEEKEAELKKLADKKIKFKAGSSVAEKNDALDEHENNIEKFRQDIEAWKKIASVPMQRQIAEQERQRQLEAEEERLMAERQESERIERERINGIPDIIDDTPNNARLRGYRRVNGHLAERQQPLQAVQGKETDVEFSNDVRPKGHFALVESAQLQPSHIQGKRNPLHFLDEAQPKERNDEASIVSAQKIAGNIRPATITTGETAYVGTPTVNARGEVIQGNSRSDALKLMYENHQDQTQVYKQYLIDNAEQFGLNPEDVSNMESPVLVRMLDVDDEQAITLGQYVAQDTESGGVERIKPKNTVKKMGNDIGTYANLLLNSNDEDMSFAELLDQNGVEVLKWMAQKGYITPTQYNSQFDTKGNLTAEAKNDLRGIMYQSIFEGGNTRLEEMFNTLPAKAQKAILATAHRDFNSPMTERMMEEIQNSIRVFYALMQDEQFAKAKNYKDAMKAVEAWQRQYQMDDVTGESYLPSEKFSNFALELATMYKGEKQSNIQGVFTELYDLIQGTKEDNLFEQADNTPRTLVQAIKEVLNIDYNGQRRNNVLVGDNKTSQQGQRGSSGNVASEKRTENGERYANDSGRATGNSGRSGIDSEDRGNQSSKDEEQDITGRSLSTIEVQELIAEMELNAEAAPEIELTIENWDSLFGEDGMVFTPIGEVKMGENQFTKLMRQGRDGKLGMIKPTLENPYVIIEDNSNIEDNAERQSSYIFIRTFKKADGSRYYYFTSITVSKDGKEVVVSNQEKKKNRIQKLLENGSVIWRTPKDATTSSAERQGLDYEQSNKAETAAKGSGITPQSTSVDKDTTISHINNGVDKKVSDNKENKSDNSLSEQIKSAEKEVNTSPTDKQKEAGNSEYKSVKITEEQSVSAEAKEINKRLWSIVYNLNKYGGYTFATERDFYDWIVRKKKTIKEVSNWLSDKVPNGELTDAVQTIIEYGKIHSQKNNAQYQKGDLMMESESEAFRRATEKTMKQLESIGIAVEMVSDEQTEAMLGYDGIKFMSERGVSMLKKAANTINKWLSNNTRGKSFELHLPEHTRKLIKKAMGRDFDSHNITSNGIAHALKNHGENGTKLNDRSIPIRKEDAELIPYIMTAPDRVEKATTDISGRESVRFYKELSNGYAVVVEKEYKNSPDDMETITMWAEKSSKATNAQQNAAPDTHVQNAILSTDVAKIQKDAENAILNDEKINFMSVSNARRRADKIKSLTPIEIIGNSKSKEELKKDYDNLPSVNKDGKIIEFYHSAFKKVYKDGGLFAQIIPQLNEILEQSVLAYSESDKLGGVIRRDGSIHKAHPNVISFENFVGKVAIDGKEYYVRTTVKRQEGDAGTHSFFVTEVDIYEKSANGLSEPNFPSGESDHQRIVDAKLQQFFDYASGKINFSRSAGIFYSNAKKAVLDIKQDKATPEQWVAMLKKNGGLKAGEDAWVGLEAWLDKQSGSVSKQEIVDYIDENSIQIEEVEYGEAPDSFDKLKKEYKRLLREEGYDYAQEVMLNRYGDDFDTAFDDLGGELVIDNEEAAATLLGSNKINIINSTRLEYTTGGLKNKHEIALVVPTIEPYNSHDEIHFGDAGDGRAVAWVRFGETVDTDGKRVLVIDEIQSKRHQDGREKGYGIDKRRENFLKARQEQIVSGLKELGVTTEVFEDDGYRFVDDTDGKPFGTFTKIVPNDERGELIGQYTRIDGELWELKRNSIPSAPFEKNWHELAMKRMLRYAAENGFDKVAWTTGEQQAERYNIGGVVESITGNRTSDGKKMIHIYTKDDNKIMLVVNEDGKVVNGNPDYNGQMLSDIIGKELSVKVMAEDDTEISGNGLRIGGEGMKGFYDNMLPAFVNKYGKKWGTKVGEASLPKIGDNGLKMHSVDVTPQMKEDVLKGQPMFHKVYHGSGAKFERFDHNFIGTGEGAQAYGWGTYVTEVKGIGKAYAEETARGKSLMSLEHRLSVLQNNINSLKEDLEIERQQVEVAKEWLCDEEEALEEYQKKGEELKKEFGEESPKYRNHIFYTEGYTDGVKKAGRALESCIQTVKDSEERLAEWEQDEVDLRQQINNWEPPKPNLYTVEIPDDNGNNYLHWEKPLSDGNRSLLYSQMRKEGIEKFDFANQKFWTGKGEVLEEGRLLYDRLGTALGSHKSASEFLNRAGFAGISYPAQASTGGRDDGARNFVIFDENDAKITNRVSFMRTSNGKIYGWSAGGKIYLTKDGINPNTPVHEYTHLWAEALMKNNPVLWSRIVNGLKDTPVWNEVMLDEEYSSIHHNDNLVASEVLSRLSGTENYRRTMEEAQREIDEAKGIFEKAEKITLLERIKQAFKDFWSWVVKTYGTRNISPEEAANMTLNDFWSGVKPEGARSVETASDVASTEEDDDVLYRNEDTKDKIEELFYQSISGNLKGKPIPIGRLTNNGKVYLEQISGISFKENVDFVLNPSDLVHIYKGHFGSNETDERSIPLDIEDIRSIVDVISFPDKIIYTKEVSGERRKMFFFLKEAENGTYNLLEIYADKKGNLTAKTFYKTKEGVSQRAMTLSKSLHTTSQTDGATLSSANIPQMFESSTHESENLRNNNKNESNTLFSHPRYTAKQKKNYVEKICGGLWIEDKQEFAKFVSAVENYVFEEDGEGIAYTDNHFYAYYWNINGDPIPYIDVYLNAEESQDVVNEVSKEINHVRRGKGIKKYIDWAIVRAGSSNGKDNGNHGNNTSIPHRTGNDKLGSNILRTGRYADTPSLYVKTSRADRYTREGINTSSSPTRAQRRQMIEHVESLAKKLHLDNIEIVNSVSGLKEKKKSAKGFYNPKTGKITIVIPNNTSIADIEKTLLHEAVAHHGLRELFGEHFETFLDNVYNNVDENIRKRIAELAIRKYDYDFHKATEEYLASLAENTDFENARQSGWWQKIKDFFADMLSKLGFKDSRGVTLTDNELRYILWRSYENLSSNRHKGVFGEAADIAKQYELGTGEFENDIEVVNREFNKELDKYINGDTRANSIFHVGRPNGVMQMFLSNLPIVMRPRILNKSSNTKHNVDIASLKNLPSMISNPIFVFKRNDNTIGVLTEIKDRDGKNVCVAIELNKTIQDGNTFLEVNDIRSIHGRETSNLILPIVNNNTLVYVDKEKGLNWLSSASYDYQQEIDSKDLYAAANIIQNFENPTLDDDILFRDGDSHLSYEKKLARESFDKLVKTGWYQSREALQDSMLSLKEFMEIVTDRKKYIEDIAGHENAYIGENRLSSVNQAEAEVFIRTLFRPMLKAISVLAHNEAEREELINYMFAKHGLERNIKMAEREATDDFKKRLKVLLGEIENESRTVNKANEAYNKQLNEFDNNALKGNIKLGKPSAILEACGINASDIFITPKTLSEHLSKHNLNIDDIRDLPKALENPIMVYEWGTKAKSTIIITQITKGYQRITVAIKLERGGKRLEINEIASIHGKDAGYFVEEMTNAKEGGLKKSLKYVNKEIALDWLGLVPPKGTASLNNQELSIANVIQNFENPTTRIQKIQDGINLTNAMYGGIKNSLSAEEAKKWFDTRKKTIDTLLKEGKITQEQYEKRIDKLNIIYNSGLVGLHGKRDYAGLTALTGFDNVQEAEAEAQKMVKEYESNHDTADLWNKVNAVSNAILRKQFDCGLMNKETFDKISSMYKFYIPLRGFDETTSAEAYAYLTHKESAFNAPIKRAYGRSSKADDPFAQLQAMAESSIMQGNRNRLVKQRFLNFVLKHPSDLVSVSELWLEYDEANDEWIPKLPEIKADDSGEVVEQKMKVLAEKNPDRYKKASDNINIPYRVVTSRELHEHQVIVKRNGKDIVLTINGNPRLAQALNGLTNPDSNSGMFDKFLKAGEFVNRYLSAAYTTHNPDFMVSNFFRDMLYTNVMSWLKESPNYALRFHKNYAKCNPATLIVLYEKYHNGTLDMNKPVEKMFSEFIINGGETGFTNLEDIDKRKKKIARELRKIKGNINLERALSLLGEKYDEVSRSVENCARFAAYMTSREFERSIDRSIYDAKEISVNFNKKGSGATFLESNGIIGKVAATTSGLGRALYVFWNAAIQGTTNFGRQVKRHPYKTMFGMAVMFLLGVLMADLGDDDEDNAYYNQPEWVRRSNITFSVTDEDVVTIPLPVEFRAIYGMGELASSVIRRREYLNDAEIAKAIACQVSQILPLDFMQGGNAFIPSAIKPVMEAFNNEDWTGRPIYKEITWIEHAPEWTKAFDDTNRHIVNVTKALSDLTGGNDFVKGKINLNPARIEHILEGYFGGYYKTADKLVKSVQTAFGAREYDPSNILLVNRLHKKNNERTEYGAVHNKYKRLEEEYEFTKYKLKHYEKAADNGIFEYAEKIDFLYNSPEYQRYEIFELYRKDIESLNDMLKNTYDNEDRKELESYLNELKKEMIEEMNKTRKRA